MNISIVSGWLPVVVRCLTVAVLILAVDWWHGGWRRQLRISVPLGVVIALPVSLVLALGSLVPSDVPWTTYLWGFVLAVAVGVAVTGWREAGRLRRLSAVAAVVLALLVTLDAVDDGSDAFPTLSRLVTFDPEHIVDIPELQQLRARVAASGQLPSQGVVISLTIPATVSHFDAHRAYVYLPPAWFAKVTPSLPTLVLLPGEPGSSSDWSSDGDADTTADAFAEHHHGVAPIIVMPDPNGTKTVDTECVNSRFGNAETYLVDDVPTFVRRTFSASSRPGSLAIGGLSAGATCSVMLALRHPTVYPTFASFSGFAHLQYQETTRQQTIDTLFGGSVADFDAHDPVLLLQRGRFDGLAGWFEVGDQDTQPLQAAGTLQPLAAKAGIATCIKVIPGGGHDFDVWSQALQDAFPWLSWRLGLTPEPTTEPATCQGP